MRKSYICIHLNHIPSAPGMQSNLTDHIAKFITLDAAQQEQVISRFRTLEIRKKQMLVTEGHACKELFFVDAGCLRLYYTDDKGVEQTIQFALENWWMTDLDAFNKGIPAAFAVQAIESGRLLAISKADFEDLLAQVPALERYFRLIYERGYWASQFRTRYFRVSKEEIYNLFAARYPGFMQRIPQKLLASFLGFTPEYLSEMRKKQSRRNKS